MQNFIINEMSIIKSIAGTLAGSFLAVPAMAAPYVNVENNAGFTGTDYNASITDLHVGYNFDVNETGDIYVQGGPAFVAVDGTDGSEGEFSGKAGLNVAATDSLGVYGELSGITGEKSNDDIVNWGAKAGVKFTF